MRDVWRAVGGSAAVALALAAVAVSAAVALALAAVAVRADAAGVSRPDAIVSMGDSFISGEGGRWMGNGSESLGTRSGTDRAAFGCGPAACRYDPRIVYGRTEGNGCHRSDVAPIQSAPIPGVRLENLACSGAQTANLWPAAAGGEPLRGEPPQADQLALVAARENVRLIVLTAGANDVGFGEIVMRCALAWARSSPESPHRCHRGAEAQLEQALPEMRRDLERVLSQVRATMTAAGYRRSGYRLAVMDYAAPFPSGPHIRYPEDGWERLTEGGCPLWDADATWAAESATPAIAAAMRAAARSAGAEFLDVQRALDGHQACDRRSRRVGRDGPSPTSAEWVRRLDFSEGSLRESLHPNAYGQRALGACIGLLYARPPGEYACHGTPGRSYTDGMSLATLGSEEQ